MSNEYVYRQVKKCEIDSADGVYTSTDGGEKFVKDSFVMYRNNLGVWILSEVSGETSTKLFYAAKSGKDLTLVNWLFRNNRRAEQSSTMKVSLCAKNTMQTRSSSSASLPVGSESNKMAAYESSSVYSSKPVGGPSPSPRQVHSSPGLVHHTSPDKRSAMEPQSELNYVSQLQNELRGVHASNVTLMSTLRDKDNIIAELKQEIDTLSKYGENVYHELQTLQAKLESKSGDEQMAADLRRIRHERSELTATNQALLDEVDSLKTRIASLASAASPDVTGPLKSENTTLRSRIAKLEGQLAAQQDKANSLQDEVRQGEEKFGQIKADLKSLTHQHHDVLRALKNGTEPTLQQVTAQKSHIAELEKELAAEKTLSAGLKNKVGDLEKILEQTKGSQEGQKEQFAVYQDALRQRDDYIAQLDAAHAAELAHLKKQYQATLIHLQDEAEATATSAAIEHAATLEKERELIKDIKDKEKAASERADTLMARAGKSYIKRDVQQTKFESPFPAGDTFLAGFKKDFLGFDTFLNDAANVVEDSEHVSTAKAGEVVVREVLVPLHAACAQYVTQQLQDMKQVLETKFHAVIDEDKPDTTDAVFWFAHVQPLFLAQVEKLTEDFILQTCLCPRARDLDGRMKEAVAAGSIEGGEGALTFPRIARLLLRALAVAALSVPRCYLYPAPGQTVQYREGFTKEVLSPGTKKHGRIQEGAAVEVVFSGLYFEKPTAENFNKLTPSEACLVRRVEKN